MPTGAKSCSGLKVTLLNRRGARVGAVEPSRSVWPSAGAWATRLAAMVPPAPGRFSTTKGRCSRSPSRSARSRASKSVVVPTLKPQMMWTGFDGQGASAAAARDIADAQPRATKVRRRIRVRILLLPPDQVGSEVGAEARPEAGLARMPAAGVRHRAVDVPQGALAGLGLGLESGALPPRPQGQAPGVK